jgi:hypothetical protein
VRAGAVVAVAPTEASAATPTPIGTAKPRAGLTDADEASSAAATLSDGPPVAMPAPRRRMMLIAGAAVVVCGTLVGLVLAKRSGPDAPGAPAPPKLAVPEATAPVVTAPPRPPLAETAPPAEAVPPAPQVPAQPAAPAAPQITLRFEIEPATATILLDDRPVKVRQLTVPKDDGVHRLKISAPGFLTHSDTVRFDESHKLVLQLQPQPKRAVPGSTRPDRGGRDRTERIESQSPYGP